MQHLKPGILRSSRSTPPLCQQFDGSREWAMEILRSMQRCCSIMPRGVGLLALVGKCCRRTAHHRSTWSWYDHIEKLSAECRDLSLQNMSFERDIKGPSSQCTRFSSAPTSQTSNHPSILLVPCSNASFCQPRTLDSRPACRCRSIPASQDSGAREASRRRQQYLRLHRAGMYRLPCIIRYW